MKPADTSFQTRQKGAGPIRTALLASGAGTTAAAFCEAQKQGRLNIRIAVIITNNSKAGVTAVAKKHQIPCRVLPPQKRPEAFDQALCEVLQSFRPDLILLAGFLKKIGPVTLSRFKNRILNSHPSLIPDFSGQGMYGRRVHQAVIAGKKKETGVTIHIVNENYDEGRILAQEKTPVLPDDTPFELEKRVKILEKRLYIQTTAKIIQDRRFDLNAPAKCAQADAVKNIKEKSGASGEGGVFKKAQGLLNIKIFKPGSIKAGLLFKGFLLGLSMIFPGISGATTAFILGIYKKLIDEAALFQVRDLKSLPTLFQRYDTGFLIPLFLGAAVAAGSFVALAPPLIQTFRFEFYSLIFGFVTASLHPVLKQTDKNLKNLVVFFCFAVASFACFHLTGVPSPVKESAALHLIFPAGAVTAGALIVPGLSGSYLLVLSGLYEYILEAFRSLNLSVIGVFTAGAVFGLIFTARAMKFLLHRYPSETFSALPGLVIGSLYPLWPWNFKLKEAPASSAYNINETFVFFVWFGLAFGLTLLGNRIGKRRASGAGPV